MTDQAEVATTGEAPLSKIDGMKAMKTAIDAAVNEYGGLTITDVNDTEQVAKVVDGHKQLKRLSGIVEKARVAVKAPHLARCTEVDDIAKGFFAVIDPVKKSLAAERDKVKAEENRIKREAEEKLAAVVQKRIDALMEYGGPVNNQQLQAVDDAEFADLLEVAKEAYVARQLNTRATVARDRLAAIDFFITTEELVRLPEDNWKALYTDARTLFDRAEVETAVENNMKTLAAFSVHEPGELETLRAELSRARSREECEEMFSVMVSNASNIMATRADTAETIEWLESYGVLVTPEMAARIGGLTNDERSIMVSDAKTRRDEAVREADRLAQECANESSVDTFCSASSQQTIEDETGSVIRRAARHSDYSEMLNTTLYAVLNTLDQDLGIPRDSVTMFNSEHDADLYILRLLVRSGDIEGDADGKWVFLGEGYPTGQDAVDAFRDTLGMFEYLYVYRVAIRDDSLAAEFGRIK